MKVTGTTKRALWPAVAALALAAPAGAAADTDLGTVDGISYYSDAGGPGEAFDVKCPGTRRLLGGGFDGTTFSRIEPADGKDRDKAADDVWRAKGYQGGTAYAICGREKTTYVKRSKPIDPTETLTVTAKCPQGMHVTGGGGYLKGATVSSGDAAIASSYPDLDEADPTPEYGWAVRARNNTAATPGTLRAHAICSDVVPTYVQATEELFPVARTAPRSTAPDPSM